VKYIRAKKRILSRYVKGSRHVEGKTPRTLRRLHNKVQMKKRKRSSAV